MNLLFLADLQIRGTNSEHRVGDYYSDVMEKFDETLSLSKKLNCQFIISAGDNFDSPLISLTICDDFIDKVEKNGIPYYSLWGNHEEIGHNSELSKSTTLAHIFRRSKLIKHLDTIEKDNVFIKGYSYYHNIEEDIKELNSNSKAEIKIAVIHAFLTINPFLPNVLHTQIKDIDTNFDIVISGHNHQPFQKIINDVRFYNLGCIGRLDITEANIEPSVLFVDIDKMKFERIKLKSAKPKEEIFDLKKIATMKAFDEDINKFIESLETTKFTELDLRGIVEQIGKEKNVDREIIDEIIRRIE